MASDSTRNGPLHEASKAPAYREVRRVAPGDSPRTPADKAPDPELGTAPIAKERYVSPEFMRLEWEKIWTKAWLLGGLESDCMLCAYNACSGWIWVFSDDPGAVWGVVLDPNNCPGGCANGGAVAEVLLYSRCSSVPGMIGDIGVATVDSRNCLVDPLYHSGPMTITRCVSGDRWTTIRIPLTNVFGNPFALTIEWGPTHNPQFAIDNWLANFYCQYGFGPGFPGCATTGRTCSGWCSLPSLTYVYLTDLDNNGTLEDLCALYGTPYPPSEYYLYPYGYHCNNLVMIVGLVCTGPTAVESTSWGHVKALFD